MTREACDIHVKLSQHLNTINIHYSQTGPETKMKCLLKGQNSHATILFTF